MAIRLLQKTRVFSIINLTTRLSSTNSEKFGFVVGVYEGTSEEALTEGAAQLNRSSAGNLLTQIQYGGSLKAGKSRVLFGVAAEHPLVSVVGLGKKRAEAKPLELRDETKEAVRTAVAAGYRSLADFNLTSVTVDACGDAEAAAEGALLGAFLYQDLKSEKKTRPKVEAAAGKNDGWERGTALATGQNLARRLMEMPANLLTPTIFAQEAEQALSPLGVEVLVRGQEWAEQKNMRAFLSVTRGSVEPPVFLELIYTGAGAGDPHIAIVGKGVTFDSGGISLKGAKNMDKMRADMGGAACTVGAMQAIAALKMPINVKGYIPLCENMPSGSATKPGDVIVASNGKTIQIDNTDAEGRLILADALHYASLGKPRAMVDMATLTGAMVTALGSAATGAFTNSDELWRAMERAGHISGDRVWRMPLWQHYTAQVTASRLADLNNQPKRKPSGACCAAAAFLQQFVTCPHWMHLDIAGVMENIDEVPYLGKGMSGRPTRTIVEFANLVAQGQTGL